ncbi:hypothetical protein LCGC14_1117530 [marine sediment metagenome]|uniref:Uncharacterized protein n=1 Tax=marine sediment metagenome TaxID=412755 RepID=A0A0F9PN39_9ZZZZ
MIFILLLVSLMLFLFVESCIVVDLVAISLVLSAIGLFIWFVISTVNN